MGRRLRLMVLTRRMPGQHHALSTVAILVQLDGYKLGGISSKTWCSCHQFH
jgi:hypothetical protein